MNQDTLRIAMMADAKKVNASLKRYEVGGDDYRSTKWRKDAKEHTAKRAEIVLAALQIEPGAVVDLASRIPSMSKSDIGGAVKSLSAAGKISSQFDSNRYGIKVWRVVA